MTRLNHIMIDLETRGTMAGCIPLSLGAVVFDPIGGTLGKEFYTVISPPDAKERFLREEEGTMEWWSKQSEEARRVLAESEHPDAPTLPKALAHFNQWLSSIGSKNALRLHAHGGGRIGGTGYDGVGRRARDAPSASGRRDGIDDWVESG